jgi:predicted helicase
LADGLADTTSWGEIVKRYPGLRLPLLTNEPGETRTISSDEPFVQILDPATGTGTFLVEVIDAVHRTLQAKWKRQGLSAVQQRDAWNQYVPRHLLPRLHAFELMMAPYAIAHMKIGLKLAETGYRFGTEERARIYLTNALEPWVKQVPLIGFDALAHEAAAVNEIKRHKRFTVVIGNPPYSASVCEPGWLMRKLDDWKEGLNETKSDLNREEWKFLRLAQHYCQTAGAGLVGFIINRDFLDGIAKRKLRENLAQSFPLRMVVDLNGDVKGNIADENVFDIEQGVAIALLSTKTSRPGLRFTSRVGTRAQKYADLSAKEPIDAALAQLEVAEPYYRWVPFASASTADAGMEYSQWMALDSVFKLKGSGIQTKNDPICIGWSENEVFERVRRLAEMSAREAREEFGLPGDGAWSVTSAQADLRQFGVHRKNVRRILYRPFDFRFIYYTHKSGGFLGRPRHDLMRHMIHGANIGLIFNRQIVGDRVSHFSVSRDVICHGTFYLGNKGQDYLATLSLRQ